MTGRAEKVCNPDFQGSLHPDSLLSLSFLPAVLNGSLEERNSVLRVRFHK